MTKKKIELVDLNKDKQKIVLKENPSVWRVRLKKYNKLFLLILLILSLTVFVSGFILTISNLSSSDKLIIKEVSVYTDLDVTSADITINSSLSDEMAENMFKKNRTFKGHGEVLLVKTVQHKNYTIKFYSDYTALKIMKTGNFVTRINSIDGSKYGINENGVINSNAKILDITKIDEKKHSWGTVIYYSDGSADITDSKVDMFVRDSKDIHENYISDNKVSYLRESDNVNGIKINYYYDGTIEIIEKNKSYLVRHEEDFVISNNKISFKNNNQATIRDTVRLSGGIRIDYYTDGGAIITDGSKKISVRKSNSIVIKDNKIYEIVDNIYVDVIDVRNNNNVVYYTNGSAVIKNYNGKTVYVSDNSDIKYKNGKISSVGSNYEVLVEDRYLNSDKILKFETIAVVDTSKFIAIVSKDRVLYNSDGSFKDIMDDSMDDNKPIKIANNTNHTIKYRLVLEESKRTNLDSKYIKYQLLVGDKYIKPIVLNNNVWMQDKISDSLSVTGKNYIIYERTLLPQESDDIRLMLWIDYDSVPNSMQDKYFYGTLRIYGWQEITLSV